MAGVPLNINVSDALNNESAATGGRISNGMIFNTSGQSIGLVKMLCLAGVALLALKILKGQK